MDIEEKPKDDARKALLLLLENGPTLSDEQLSEIEQVREHLRQWRTGETSRPAPIDADT